MGGGSSLILKGSENLRVLMERSEEIGLYRVTSSLYCKKKSSLETL